MGTKNLTILLAKPGLDGHDVGVKVLGHALVEAGFSVLYTGLRKPVSTIVQTAKTQNVDVIGLSILSGTQLVICRQMKEEMAEAGLTIPWIVGGNIPDEDVAAIVSAGAAAAFPTGTSYEEVIEYLNKMAGT